jgi:hypothetical protein
MTLRKKVRLSGTLLAILLAAVFAESAQAQNLSVLDTVTERCSTFVWISPDYYATIVNPPGAIRLSRINRNAFTPWSNTMFVQRFGPGHLVRWHCGFSPERSPCPQETQAVQGRLGPSRLLQIRCLGRPFFPPPPTACPAGQRCCGPIRGGQCTGQCVPRSASCP